MADVAGADPLRQDLCRLAAFLEASEVRLFVAGGYGLILKAEYLRENELRTVAPTPFPRATTNLDVFLSADVIADARKMSAVQEGLETMGYEPVPGRENYQWSRVVEFGGRGVTVKFDLLGQIPPDTVGLSVRPRRMRPHGFTGLHHAFDLYRIVAMLTEEEWDEVRDLHRSHADSGVVRRATAIVEKRFSNEEQMGALRIRGHVRRAGVDTTPYPIAEFLSDLRELMRG